MTQNQIRYQEHLENVRNNTAVLDETKRANQAREMETNRHNLQTEQTGWATLNEAQRHNYVSENIGYYQAGEQARHNYATEGIQSLYNQGMLENQSQRNELDYAASIYQTDTKAATDRANAILQTQTSKDVARINQQTSAATNEANKEIANINKQSRFETTSIGMFTKLLKLGGGAVPSDFMQSTPIK